MSMVAFCNNNEVIKVLIKYTDENDMILELNEKKNKYGEYPLLLVTENNNIEMTKIIIDYANKHSITIKK